ncbi:hypothetical protein A3B87_03475 [Candidatus Kuenenbacteria bacterium RIFCSPHIGHO2_02_FULL_39_13]|uniref:Uncharacterized protein n=1 Tax=Candidatus Kuenenbacteria bacterium RIFCSPHIGHO2_02_FULL_39_13 TaxID=1798561 RepID=A0A1F6FME1_9BACT|nr:MAG: hypothetical protein A3B87_03475 [Candidatus Kuenenbacteria bacterium RIFCSPHIGHO2_02_FULL_39_13]
MAQENIQILAIGKTRVFGYPDHDPTGIVFLDDKIKKAVGMLGDRLPPGLVIPQAQGIVISG